MPSANCQNLLHRPIYIHTRMLVKTLLQIFLFFLFLFIGCPLSYFSSEPAFQLLLNHLRTGTPEKFRNEFDKALSGGEGLLLTACNCSLFYMSQFNKECAGRCRVSYALCSQEEFEIKAVGKIYKS